MDLSNRRLSIQLFFRKFFSEKRLSFNEHIAGYLKLKKAGFRKKEREK